MITLTLFTTSHCHLCEQAVQLITQLYPTTTLVLVEIADDEQLLEEYGERIPVLQRSDNLSELGWPITSDKLAILMR